MSTDMNLDVQAIWEFEDRKIPVSTVGFDYGINPNVPSVNHAELYGLLRSNTQAYRCRYARVLLTVTEPIYVMFCDFADRIVETYSIPYFEYLQFMDLYIHTIDPEDGSVRWQVEGF